ncbi:hypothetical protein [Streptomyces sp. NPDC002132]|uniref:hypothetical protein n=1 Tax=unclassified Streptomyces TaxID=2593676 RepID=UPI00332B098C
MRTRWGRLYAGAGAATLSLLAATATAAHAAPAADPVDVRAGVEPVRKTTAPGKSLGLRAGVDVVSGKVSRLALRLALPEGVTFEKNVDDATNADCTPSADGRTVTCVTNSENKSSLAAYVLVKVDTKVTPGTELVFTATADIGDAVDPKPQDNTATGKVKVGTAADLGIAWNAPAGPVKVGERVKADLVVTNHGPGPARLGAVSFSMGEDYWPERGSYDESCWADPYYLTCDVEKDLAPGDTVTLPFAWYFPKKAAGTTYRVPASLDSPNELDPNRSNDEATLVLKFAKGPASPSPTTLPTPSTPPASSPGATPRPSATPSSSAPSSTAPAGGGSQPSPQGGGGQLARTGGGPAAATAGAATALVLTGGAVVLWNRGRRRERGSHL